MSSSYKDVLSRLVYATDQGDLRDEQHTSAKADAERERLDGLDGIVRIRRETAGRKGKGVTTISGIPLAIEALTQLTTQLKKRCGSGGALKAYVIEIQGDHRDTVKAFLEEKGFTVKHAGG